MTIQLNGEPFELAGETHLLALVQRFLNKSEVAGVAVAKNEQVIPRAQWALTSVLPGDRFEIVSLVGGG